MDIEKRRPLANRMWLNGLQLVMDRDLYCWPDIVAAQGVTGALIGTVKDAQGGVLPGAVVRVGSPALIGGPQT